MTPGSLDPRGSQGQRPLITTQFPWEEYELESPGDLTKLPTSMVEDESGAQYSAFQWVSSRVIQDLSNQSGWKEQGLMALPEESCTAYFFLFAFSPGTAVFIYIEILYSSSLKICSLAKRKKAEAQWKYKNKGLCASVAYTSSQIPLPSAAVPSCGLGTMFRLYILCLLACSLTQHDAKPGATRPNL